jgi:two-component system, chemotaxis family, chemotaxis protein CheY
MPHDILVVDDSATIRAMIRKALSIIGLDVGEIYEAANGMEALAQLADHPVAVVLADINMPVMNGLQLVDVMRRNKALKTTPVVIVSTEGSQQRLDELSAHGIAGYIRKPFRPEQLSEILKPILGMNHDEQDRYAHTAEDLF